MEQKLRLIIQLYEELLEGDGGTKMGLLQGLDHYYIGSWDEELEEIEKLKIEINE